MATVNIGGDVGYILGSALTGSDGAQNRTYNTGYTDVSITGLTLFINGAYIHYGIHYSVSSGVLTFAQAIYNDQVISGTFITGYTTTSGVDYCTAQDVWNELDGKTSSDISEARVVDAIQRAEGIIDTKTGTFFKVITITDEVHTGDRYSLDVSPDYLDIYPAGTNMRRDFMGGQMSNRVKTRYSPIITVSSLSVNTAGPDAADSWTALTQQTGSAGDFVIEDYEAGIIDFLSDFPRLGKRSWKLTYTCGHDPSSSDRRVLMRIRVVERLCILLACQSIITMKSSGSMFDSMRDVKIGAIEIKAGASSGKLYLESIQTEIDFLWKQLGELGVEVV